MFDEEDVDGNFDSWDDDDDQNNNEGRSTPTKRRRVRNELTFGEKKASQAKKFQRKWEDMPAFKAWLNRVPNDPNKFQCTACNGLILSGGKSEIMRHASTQKHLANVKSVKGTPDVRAAFSKTPENRRLKDMAKTAEITLASFFAEHNVAIEIVEHLVPLLQSIFKDSQIAKHMTLGRTECTDMIKNIVAKEEERELVENLIKVPFSAEIDGSTDITAHKNMCVVTKYACPKTGRKRTQLLELVEIDARDCTAAALYGAFKKCLEVSFVLRVSTFVPVLVILFRF